MQRCLKGILMMFVFAIVLAFSGSCYAAVTFQADGGKDFVLDFNTFLENKSLFISGQSSPEPETKQGSVTYKAKNGTYILTYNNTDNYGQYVVFVNGDVVDIPPWNCHSPGSPDGPAGAAHYINELLRMRA